MKIKTTVTRALSLGIVASVLAIGGCGKKEHSLASAAPQPGEVRVSIDNFTFAPAEVTVDAGATVVWVNHDDVPHTVTAYAKQFNSGAMDTDMRFAHQFTTPGTYEY